MSKQLETSGALEEFRQNPSPEKAVGVHQRFMQFQDYVEAEAFQRTMQSTFPNDALIHSYLGDALSSHGRWVEALPMYRRALELRPDLPSARLGLGRGELAAGNLDGARQHLAFLEQPGSEKLYSLAPLEDLATALQRKNRHGEALALLTLLKQRLPQLEKNPVFDLKLHNSAKALAGPTSSESKAPKWPFLQRFAFGKYGYPIKAIFFITLGILALVIGTKMVVNSTENAISTVHPHRLYIVNQTGEAAEVDITGQGAVRVPLGVHQFKIGEGHIVCRLKRPFTEEVSFDIHTMFLDRLGETRCWVWNLGGKGIFLREQMTYVSQTPGTFMCYYGKPAISFNDVDFPFVDFPKTVQRNSGLVKVGLELYQKPSEHLMASLSTIKRDREALALGEWALTNQPNNDEVLAEYFKIAQAAYPSRSDQFLSNGLSIRPVLTSWHRYYQRLHWSDREAMLLPLYDDFLAEEPMNGRLLYLRGRIEPDSELRMQYFKGALTTEPDDPFVNNAFAYEMVAAGDWAGARPFIDKAFARLPNESQIRAEWMDTHLALKEFPVVEDYFAAILQTNSANGLAAYCECLALCAEGKFDSAHDVSATFRQAVQSRTGKASSENTDLLDSRICQLQGDFIGAEKFLGSDTKAKRPYDWAGLCLNERRLPDAERWIDSQYGSNIVAQLALAMAIGYRLDGNVAAAQKWEQRLSHKFYTITLRPKFYQDLIEGKTSPTPDVIRDVSGDVEEEALLFTDLGLMHPELKKALFAEARKRNVSRTFPYEFVAAVIGPDTSSLP